MTIYKQISEIMREIKSIGKSQVNKMQGFKYRGIDDVYNALQPIMAKHGVFTMTEVLEERREERTTKSGGVAFLCFLKIKFSFYCEDGSSLSSIVIGEAADQGDKSTNKAMAIAHKYALMQTFAIPTEDTDPDAYTHELEPKEKKVETKKPAPEGNALVDGANGSGVSDGVRCNNTDDNIGAQKKKEALEMLKAIAKTKAISNEAIKETITGLTGKASSKECSVEDIQQVIQHITTGVQ